MTKNFNAFTMLSTSASGSDCFLWGMHRSWTRQGSLLLAKPLSAALRRLPLRLKRKLLTPRCVRQVMLSRRLKAFAQRASRRQGEASVTLVKEHGTRAFG